MSQQCFRVDLLSEVHTDALPTLCASPRCVNSRVDNTNYCQKCIDRERVRQAKIKAEGLKKGIPPYLHDEPVLRGGDFWIYFIQAGESGPIKIGRSQNLKGRMLQLISGSPAKLKLIARMKSKDFVEGLFHQEFAAYRLHGEWFDPAPEILDMIDRLKKGDYPQLLGGKPWIEMLKKRL